MSTIDIRNLEKGSIVKVDSAFDIIIPDEFGAEDKKVTAALMGQLVNNGGLFRFTGTIVTEIKMYCALCLKPVSVPFSLEMDETFSKSQDDGDVSVISDKTVDLKPAAEALLYSQIPVKTVCGENCRGLCHKCGADLNTSNCGCETEEIDERFVGLNDLFKDESYMERIKSLNSSFGQSTFLPSGKKVIPPNNSI